MSLYETEKKNDKIEETLLRALVEHKSSKYLYKYAINFTLCQLQQNLENKQVAPRYFAEVNKYVRMVFENIRDYEYYFDILRLTESYNFEAAITLTTKIEEKIEVLCSNIPKVWDLFAQRGYEGKVIRNVY